MQSIISKERKCFLCGSVDGLEEHHIFGNANRNNSEKYGLKVFLCRKCHDRIHFSKDSRKMMDSLRSLAQKKFEEAYPELDFLKIFHRNWK